MRKITLAADVEQIRTATDFAGQQLEAAGCPPRVRALISVAIDELYSNIAYYAYPGGGGEVTLGVDAAENRAVIRFEDTGMPYDPLAHADPDTGAALQDRPVGGLGIFLVKKTMDEMKYESSGGRNVLTIIKKWQ